MGSSEASINDVRTLNLAHFEGFPLLEYNWSLGEVIVKDLALIGE